MNELRQLKEFKDLLANYQIADDSKRILAQTNFVALLAPTSSGRNTVIRELLKTGQYHFIVSDTTRKPRVNDGVKEKDGVNYWFRSETEVLHDIKKGKYLEAEVIHGQQVSGISMRELEKARDENRIAITDMDLGGALNILKAKPDATVILLLPPEFDEWQRRIKHRGKMNAEEHRRRLETARRIIEVGLQNKSFIFVVNDTIEKAMEQVHTVAYLGQIDAQAQVQARNLAEQLYIETTAFLDTIRA